MGFLPPGDEGIKATVLARFDRVLIPSNNLHLPVRRWLLQRWMAWIHPRLGVEAHPGARSNGDVTVNAT